MAFVTPVMEDWLEWEIVQWVHHEGSIRQPIGPWANALTTKLHLTPISMAANFKGLYTYGELKFIFKKITVISGMYAINKFISVSLRNS